MRYCEAVINETLRLLPPVMVASRVADHDLDIGKCFLTCRNKKFGI